MSRPTKTELKKLNKKPLLAAALKLLDENAALDVKATRAKARQRAATNTVLFLKARNWWDRLWDVQPGPSANPLLP